MNNNTLKWFLLTVLALVWGSSFILIKKGLVALTPLQLGSLRIIFAALFLLSIGFYKLRAITAFQWKYLVLTAIFGTFIPAYLFAIAQTEISSSVSSILNSLTPLNTMVLGFLFFGLTVQKKQFIGIIIGLFGSILLIYNGATNNPTQNYYYTLLIITASICYAINVNLIKKYLSDLSPLSISTGNFAVMLLPAIAILYQSGFLEIYQQQSAQHSMIFILILGVVGTGMANIIFFKLIQLSSPVFATSVTYLIPVVAFGWGLLDSEFLSPVQLLGAFIILFGVYLSSRK